MFGFFEKVDPFSNSGSEVAKFGKCFGIFRIKFVVKLTTKFAYFDDTDSQNRTI